MPRHLVLTATSPNTYPLLVTKRWATSLGIWAVGTGAAGLFLLSVTPLVKQEFLSKVPLIGDYFEDKTPPSDKPF